LPHPNPSPKEKGLKRKYNPFLVFKVLSFGEDLGEAIDKKLISNSR
jgi:hypothetical protein